MTNPNDPAYPGIDELHLIDEEAGKSLAHIIPKGGLTKREYFAAMAMQGYISRGSDRMQEHAVKDADALIRELSK